MKIKTILVICLSAGFLYTGILATPVAAQGLLPSSFGEWMASAPPAQAAAAQIEQLSPDHAAVLREYGIDAVERRDFAEGPNAATITLYKMVDPTAAFG